MIYCAIVEEGNVNYVNLHSVNRVRYPDTYRHRGSFYFNSIFYQERDFKLLKQLHPGVKFIPKDVYFVKRQRNIII